MILGSTFSIQQKVSQMSLSAPSLFTLIPKSTLTPVCVGFYDRWRKSAGRSAGLLNGVSTLGNIAGVLLAALVLIPTFGIHSLLHVWWISSVAIELPPDRGGCGVIFGSAGIGSRWSP